MSWKVTALYSNASGEWSVEFTNVSGGVLFTNDFYVLTSTGPANTLAVSNLADFIGLGVGDGDSFGFGDTDLPETNLGISGISGLDNLDFVGISTTPDITGLIDGIGKADLGSTPWTAGLTYTADPSRPVDTDPFDAFNPTDDFSTTTYCFLEGTSIETDNGSRSVEALQIGDNLRTADGRLSPVKWLGWQTVTKQRQGPHMQPVRITSGALGGGIPVADLTVTADHGVVIGGFVINASALVNGDTIDFVPLSELGDSFTVYHIETEDHDVILANGTPSETFMDAAGRKAFDNYQEYLDLYGVDRIIPEMTMHRISSSRLLPQSVKDQLGCADVKDGLVRQTA